MSAEKNNLLTYVKPFIRRFLLAFVCLVMVAIFSALFPLIIQPVMDELFSAGGSHLSGKARYIYELIQSVFGVSKEEMSSILPWLLFFSFLGQAIFNFLSLYLMKTLGLKVIRDIRDKMYKNLVNQSIEFLSKTKTGDLISRISNDIEKIKYAVSETLAIYVREVFTLIALLCVVFYQDWKMSLYSFLIIPAAAGFLFAFGKKVKKKGIQSQEAIGELSNFLSESVSGNKIVKAYNMENFEIDKFAKLNMNHYRINSKIALLYSLAPAIMHTIGGLVAAIIITIGMERIAAGVMSPGQFLSFLTALFLMYNPMKRLSQVNNDYQQGIAGYERIRHIISTTNPIKDKPGSIEMKDIKGSVEFRDISFAYRPGIPVIEAVNFQVNPDEMVALVGASGSGKTTLMNLLIRFYETDKGRISIDGRDIKDFTIKSLRDAIGLVTQDVFLFNETVRNNIAYGSRDYSFAEIEKAAEIARAADFIEQLPQQYDTLVGERGAFLSNGQRQRISIARAILKKPALLIFDEATSSLDTESEKLIQEAMVDVMKGRTTFVIAHRLSTIIEADNILVIDKGRIKENGSHKELLKKKGLYYSLYNLQFPEMGIIM
ncbi:MAG: ABC transporter ATP-binding protein [Candidatus Aminicenantes bacterium]|nr:ABC transporter ATP-binding protein [Candidatus Aminicenantes bacterium]